MGRRTRPRRRRCRASKPPGKASPTPRAITSPLAGTSIERAQTHGPSSLPPRNLYRYTDPQTVAAFSSFGATSIEPFPVKIANGWMPSPSNSRQSLVRTLPSCINTIISFIPLTSRGFFLRPTSLCRPSFIQSLLAKKTALRALLFRFLRRCTSCPSDRRTRTSHDDGRKRRRRRRRRGKRRRQGSFERTRSTPYVNDD